MGAPCAKKKKARSASPVRETLAHQEAAEVDNTQVTLSPADGERLPDGELARGA